MNYKTMYSKRIRTKFQRGVNLMIFANNISTYVDIVDTNYQPNSTKISSVREKKISTQKFHFLLQMKFSLITSTVFK